MAKTFSTVVLPRYTNPDLPVMMPFGIIKEGLVVWNFEFGSLAFIWNLIFGAWNLF